MYLFICNSYSEAVSKSDYIGSKYWMTVNNELNRKKKQQCPDLRYSWQSPIETEDNHEESG
jgi:hypothetical protein